MAGINPDQIAGVKGPGRNAGLRRFYRGGGLLSRSSDRSIRPVRNGDPIPRRLDHARFAHLEWRSSELERGRPGIIDPDVLPVRPAGRMPRRGMAFQPGGSWREAERSDLIYCMRRLPRISYIAANPGKPLKGYSISALKFGGEDNTFYPGIHIFRARITSASPGKESGAGDFAKNASPL